MINKLNIAIENNRNKIIFFFLNKFDKCLNHDVDIY